MEFGTKYIRMDQVIFLKATLLGPFLNILSHLREKNHNKYEKILPIVFGKSGSSVMAARNKASAKSQIKELIVRAF